MTSNQLLIKYALRYPLWNLVTIVLGFSGAIFSGVSTTLIVPVVLDFLGQKVNLSEAPQVIQKVMNLFDGVSGERRLILMTGVILLAIILKNFTSYLNTLASSHLSRLLSNDLRREGLRLLLDVDLDFYNKSKIGDLINRISQEVYRAASAVRIIIQMATISATILVFIAILISISWKLTLASTGLLFLVALANQYSILRSKKFGRIMADNSRAFSNALVDILTGIRLIKAASNEDKEYQRLDHLISEREKADFKSQASQAAISPINEVAGVLAILAIVLLGRIIFADQLESLSAVLLTYLFVLFRLLPIIGQLNNQRNGLANATASVEFVHDFLRRDNKDFMSSGDLMYSELKEGIRFEGVTFSYPGSRDLVLQDVNLYIPQGTTLALVGSSGAGKSTMADLLSRFYDPTEGQIKIDSTNLRNYDLRSYRKSLGIVSQDTFLFNDSVRNNIAYAWENVSEDEIIEAAKLANAYEFIMQLPQGFDTPLGDRGVLLSGGQRQRIAIARALLRNPDILILDEATSALDSVSERLVQQAIDNLSRNRTTLVIAHRLSTVQKAHQIAVMEKGRVIELGSHEELLRKGGSYARLCLMQFSEEAKKLLRYSQQGSLMKASYEIRTKLNSMIGSLKLLVDGIVDSPAERDELTEEAYLSAIHLLQILEKLENEAEETEEDEVELATQ